MVNDSGLLLSSFHSGLILSNLSTALSVILLFIQIFVIFYNIFRKVKDNKDLKVEDLEQPIEDLERLIDKINNNGGNDIEREWGNVFP